MAIQGLMLRACSSVGYSTKSLICSRFVVPLYQQTAGVKSVESKLGLPEKPKRPLSPFFRYIRSMRLKVKAENPELTTTDIVKKLSQDWKVCDPLVKKQFTEESQKSAQEYGAALEKYHLSLSKEDFERIREAKAKEKESREARAHRRKLKKLNKPKRPLNAYMLFIENERVKGTFNGVSNLERLKVGGELWKNAPERVVSEYKEKAAAAYRQYKTDLEAWEERMAADGYVDVIYETPSKPKKKKA